MDGVISQAQATLGTLVFQRSTFGGINSKLSNVASRLPTVQRAFLILFTHFFALCFLYVRLWPVLSYISPCNSMVKTTAGEHYSGSNKEEKVDGYNHSFTCCGCMHISHIHLLDNQVEFAHSFFSSLCWATSGFPMMLICSAIIGVRVKNLKMIKNINIVYSKFHPCLCSLANLLKCSVIFEMPHIHHLFLYLVTF